MSDTNNADRKPGISKPTRVARRSKCRASDVDSGEEDFALETRFRGFEKKPLVSLRRIDIAPYLRKMNAGSDAPLDSGTTTVTEFKSEVPTDFPLNNCSVKVLNDDLFKLKADFISQMYDMFPYITCRICKKNYPDEKKLRNHQSTKHMIIYQAKPKKRVSFNDHVIVHELKEYHKCRKCTRIFEDYALLKSHMKKYHKKRKCYICHYCTKSFVDRSIFKIHIKLHCDSCGELLPNKAKYAEHRRNICRVIKIHRCSMCQESFSNLMDLREHSNKHSNTSYTCDICYDKFQTKCALVHHIAFLHSDSRPITLYEMRNLGIDRLYLCNFCGESSVDKDLIERHVGLLQDLSNRVMTGYKDYYFCDQCQKRFDIENDMIQHKWSHFLKTNNNEKSNSDKSLCRNDNMNPDSTLSEALERKTYNVHEILPLHMQPIVIIKKMDVAALQEQKELEMGEIVNFRDINNSDEKEYFIFEGFILKDTATTKPVIDPKSKKTLLSKHQCPHCYKYFSTGYCLRRHIQTQHLDLDNLQCKVCEETFYWPSLLLNHRCLRASEPEIPFNDARPEIHFDNLGTELNSTQDLDDFNINDDYPMNCVDFEVPAPIVELTESDNNILPDSYGNHHIGSNRLGGSVMQNHLMQFNGQGSAVSGVVGSSEPLDHMVNALCTDIDANMLREDNLDLNRSNIWETSNDELGLKIVMKEVPIEF